MKNIKRITALLLALIMVLSSAPLSIFAEDTVAEWGELRSVAGAYVSAVVGEENKNFGSEENVRIDNQHIYFVTFK